MSNDMVSDTVLNQAPDPSVLQRRAAYPKASAWVNASAGSGKTKVLTDRVLSLLLAGARPHAILCLTFTKAAAGEMANRITSRLSLWARVSEDALAENLLALLGEPPTPDELDKARRLFAKLQESDGGVRIDTMHAFCQGLLQRFPIEANVAPHFEVLDERDQRLMFQQARDSLVLRVNEEPDSPLGQAWARVIARQNEGSFGRMMWDIMKGRAALKHASANDIARVLDIDPGLTPDAIRTAALGEEAFDRQALLAALPNLLNANAKALNDLGTAIQLWLETPAACRNITAHCSALLTGGQPRKLRHLNPFKQNGDLAEPIEQEQARLVAMLGEASKVEALADTQALLLVAKFLIDRYTWAKQVRSRLDYDDLIQGAGHLLVDTGAAWVHYKLDGGIDHVLVDEAQDTSRAQWKVIEGLIAEFYAGEGAQERERTFFAVGDPKQSIYSFQGADPAAFIERRTAFSERATAIGQEWRDVPLNVSFRSAAPVLRLVDEVFATPQKLGVGDEDIQHIAHRSEAPGWIEVWPLIQPAEADGKGDPWTLPRVYEHTLNPEEQLARAVARRIKDLIDSGENLHATGGQPIRPKDIMVLVRRRRRFGAALVSALKREGVPVAGVDRMALARQLVVQDLVAFAEFLLLPSDDLTLAALLKGPFFAWDEARLFHLAHDRQQKRLWAALLASDHPDDQADAAKLRHWRARAPQLSPFALFSELLTAQGGRAAIRARLGPEADDPLDEFLSLALSFHAHGPPTLQHFLHWLSAGDIEIKREMEQGERDEVRLLTVHAAKGLQAPIVFLPDTIFAVRADTDALTWHDTVPIWAASRTSERDPVSQTRQDELAIQREQEEARLLYVALTRAEDRLYICGWQGKKASGEGTWYHQITQACERLVEAEEANLLVYGDDLVVADGVEGEGFVMGIPPFSDGIADRASAPLVALPPWATELPQPEPSPARPLSPSRPSPLPPAARSPLRDQTEAKQRFQRGTLLHRLFQFLPGTAPAHRMDTAARILADAKLPPEELEQYVASAARVLDDPRFAAIFSDDALSEAPLTGLIDGQVVSGIVDRLLIAPAKVLIIDYKTNRAPPPGPNAIPPAYAKQMLAYARLLRTIYPTHSIEAALLWTEAPRLDLVPLNDSVN